MLCAQAWKPCDPMNRSTPGLPDHHQLPEFTQTHVHRVGATRGEDWASQGQPKGKAEIPVVFEWWSVPVVFPGVANVAGNPLGAQQGRRETWRRGVFSLVHSLSRIRLFATPWTVAYQATPSMGLSRQGY